MKKKITPVMRGLAAIMAVVLALATVGTGIANTYNGGMYIVEAEGIYVGCKYYKTRYYDATVNPAYNAGSSTSAALTVIFAGVWVVLTVLPETKKEK